MLSMLMKRTIASYNVRNETSSFGHFVISFEHENLFNFCVGIWNRKFDLFGNLFSSSLCVNSTIEIKEFEFWFLHLVHCPFLRSNSLSLGSLDT